MGDRITHRHTDTHTDTQTDGANHSIVAHFVRGNYKNITPTDKLFKIPAQVLRTKPEYSILWGRKVFFVEK